MSWLQQLYDTYEKCSKNAEFRTGDNILLPIYHSFQQAHIEVILNEDAKLVDARIVEKEETLIPVTEDSAGRAGSKDAPHPLADKIQYCAGDYKEYGGNKKPFFTSYQSQLSHWCDSEFGHPKVKLILKYIDKKKLVFDLVKKGILKAKNNVLIEDWKQDKNNVEVSIFKFLQKDPSSGKYDQGNAFVRWIVEIPGDTKNPSETWKDESIYDSWKNYYVTLGSEKNVCHVTGKIIQVSSNHPRRIRHSGDGAKLISTPTDQSFFTYKGMFYEATESCTIGEETTQKAHNALRWLIARQGFKNNEQVIVSWAVTGKQIPSITDSSFELLDDLEEDYPTQEVGDAGQRFALRLKKKIVGYNQKLGPTERIIIMGLDSASTGRISVTFYRELSGSDFLVRIEGWHSDFSWLLITETIDENHNFKKHSWIASAPSPFNIALAAYGERVERDDKLKKSIIERILPCITDGKNIPKDLVESCIRNVSNKHLNKNFGEEYWKWQKSLGIACALYKGFYKRHAKKEERRIYSMSLEQERKTRDYLYGRLLALAEKIERKALDNAGENRITNAERLMLRFSSRPFSTWKIIEESLRPYKNRLRASQDVGLLGYFENEINKVYGLFSSSDFTDDRPLSGEYLLGYHCQMQFRKNANDNNKIKNDENKAEGE